MNYSNNGLPIEAFAVNALNIVTDNNFDRHHPLSEWASADVSGSATNFTDTKSRVTTLVNALTDKIYKNDDYGQGKENALINMEEISKKVASSSNPAELAQVLNENNDFLLGKNKE